MNNTYVVTKDPIWHRWVDGLVILAIGFGIGVVLMGALTTYETEIITVKSVRQLPTVNTPEEQSGNVDAPRNPVKFNEI